MTRVSKVKENNLEIEKQNQIQLRELEAEYISSKINELPAYIEEQKNEITKELIDYAARNEYTLTDRLGNVVGTAVRLKPIVITNYFFKPVCPITSKIPEYNAEKLGIVFDYYLYIIAEINDKIGNFPSSLTTFCKLAGITMSTLRSYKNSSDIDMRNLVEKIYDQVSDENVTLSQMGMVRERSTIFKMKSQNEVTETVTPNVNLNFTEIVDTTVVNDRINKYKNFLNNKNKR